MIIEKQEDVTAAVLAELKRAPNARFREMECAPGAGQVEVSDLTG